ncbi:hypothetical protein B0H17DRAFT_1145827 [Mycena rosella]|uniref:DUF6818 domain-containing protein n=1 Tax=Mycena rosella TaxID=1033263 RepID=A0AAD7CQX6_MYCRO|nr:hypothetical protein B0H17DRAFT_1145827 [Mycena rosella]
MSDPAPPPFAQPAAPAFAQPNASVITQSSTTTAPSALPGVHYDGSGRPWFCDRDGNWVPLILPQQAPAPTVGGLAQSTVQMSSSSAPFPSHLIDPALLPLPEDDDRDLSEPSVIAQSRGLKAAPKIAGARRKTKDKGKKRQHYSSDEDDDSEGRAPVAKRGHPQGSSNFSKEETKHILDLIEKELPLGPKGWKPIYKKHAKWSQKHGRPERGGKSLGTKYKQLLKMKKPTGEGVCPPEVKRVQQIESLINQKAGTRDLNDSDFDGDTADISSDDGSIEVLDSSSLGVRTAVARRVPSPPLRRTRMNAPELVAKLSQAFDPNALKARDDERAHRSLENTQLFTVSQQLRDVQATNESLRTQITTLQAHVHNVERARDRAEMMLELSSGVGGGRFTQHDRPSPPRSKQPSRISRTARRYQENPDLIRINGKVRCETVCPEGGSCTYWVSDYSSDESDKENKDPHPPSHGYRFPRHRSPSPLDLSCSSGSSALRLRSPIRHASPPPDTLSSMTGSARDANTGPSMFTDASSSRVSQI